MVRIVSDSSTLILLAKCNLLEMVCELFQVIAPETVIHEVASEELVKNYPDAALIANLASKGVIKVQKPPDTANSLPVPLHTGEKDALILARKYEGALFATDDGKAIKAARFLKVPFIITPKIVVDLFRSGKISLKRSRDSLEKLSIIGRYSPEIIADALVSLMEEKHGKAYDNKDT